MDTQIQNAAVIQVCEAWRYLGYIFSQQQETKNTMTTE